MKRLSEGFYPSLIVAIIIMVIMGTPGNYFPTVVTLWDWLSPDKVVHLLLFGFFSFVTLWGYRNTITHENEKYLRKITAITLIITVTYGGMTELLQRYVFVGRYGSTYDFYADTAGCILGIVGFLFYYKKKLKK